jgi:hypothetical protein
MRKEMVEGCIADSHDSGEKYADAEKYCRYSMDTHRGVYISDAVHQANRKVCHGLLGCMYTKQRERCTTLTVWSFIGLFAAVFFEFFGTHESSHFFFPLG